MSASCGQPAPVSASAQAGRVQRRDPSGRGGRYHSSADSLQPERRGEQRRASWTTPSPKQRGGGGYLLRTRGRSDSSAVWEAASPSWRVGQTAQTQYINKQVYMVPLT
ncbi:uncharacterized protein PAE49_022168 [Odontesthes bonariensis]